MQVHVQGTKFFSLSVCDHKICQLDLEILTPNCDKVVENSENCHPIASKCLILPMSYKSCFLLATPINTYVIVPCVVSTVHAQAQ